MNWEQRGRRAPPALAEHSGAPRSGQRATHLQVLAEIAKQPDFPAFSTHIQEVMSAVEDENASLRQLTDIVLRDYSLTLRVLRMANSVCYSRSGRTLVSVAHSITLLGTEAIRGLAGGVALFEALPEDLPGAEGADAALDPDR